MIRADAHLNEIDKTCLESAIGSLGKFVQLTAFRLRQRRYSSGDIDAEKALMVFKAIAGRGLANPGAECDIAQSIRQAGVQAVSSMVSISLSLIYPGRSQTVALRWPEARTVCSAGQVKKPDHFVRVDWLSFAHFSSSFAVTWPVACY